MRQLSIELLMLFLVVSIGLKEKQGALFWWVLGVLVALMLYVPIKKLIKHLKDPYRHLV